MLSYSTDSFKLTTKQHKKVLTFILICCFSDANSTENEPDTTHPVVS